MNKQKALFATLDCGHPLGCIVYDESDEPGCGWCQVLAELAACRAAASPE